MSLLNKSAWLFILALFWPHGAWSETVHVAVAANFKKPFQQLVPLFEKKTDHRVLVSSGSSGKLYAQIVNGAPFHLFLSADQTFPQLLVQQSFALPESQFSYARGRLVYWAGTITGKRIDESFITSVSPEKISLANPKVAPYGQAAKQTLSSLGVWEKYAGKMAFGENVGQALAFIASGGVQGGFVALSQALELKVTTDHLWIVPDNLYSPLLQDAALLKQARNNPGAVALLAYLKEPETRALIKKMGYALP